MPPGIGADQLESSISGVHSQVEFSGLWGAPCDWCWRFYAMPLRSAGPWTCVNETEGTTLLPVVARCGLQSPRCVYYNLHAEGKTDRRILVISARTPHRRARSVCFPVSEQLQRGF